MRESRLHRRGGGARHRQGAAVAQRVGAGTRAGPAPARAQHAQPALEWTQAILGASDDLLQFARAQHAEPQGTLRLTCAQDFGLGAANRWITGYLHRWPQMAVDVDYSVRRIDLVHEGSDLALRVGPLDDCGLAARRLGELRYGLFAAPAASSGRARPPHRPRCTSTRC
jgi:DNA-binding transcriptional LysR family regulator